MASAPLLEVSGLTVDFHQGRRSVRAVSDVSFTIDQGETLGLVGESGSGKTTTGRAILGLVPAGAGRIVFGGRDITADSRRERRRHAGDMRAVFQDPYSSLNPALRVSVTLLEGLTDAGMTRIEAEARMAELLEQVGLSPAVAMSYPAALSGGQRQRLAIARALISSPRLVICDEPVSALDVSVQAQVLNLLRELQRESSLSYLFIGHDLDVVRYMSDRIAVLYRGRIVEDGPAEIVARHPRHPYTQALVAATPEVDAEPRRRRAARGAATRERGVQSSAAEGCPFAPRCPIAIDLCRTDRPPLDAAAEGGHVACHRYEPDAAVSARPAWPARSERSPRATG